MSAQYIVPAFLFVLISNAASAEDLRVGLIGLDTSHVIAFTKVLNDPTAPNHVAGAKVIAGYKGGSPDNETSRSRIDGYTEQLQKEFGVRVVDSIEELCTLVDAVMLTSVDGRPHLKEVRPVFAARKPVFIDKPVAGSLRDAVEIFRLAKEDNVPCFSSSSYRYYAGLVELKTQNVGKMRSAISYGPAHLEPHHPDLFWYGVHPTEALFTILGTGCQTVVRTATPDTDVVTGAWSDGRVGTLVGLRNQATPHKVIVFGTEAVAEQKEGPDDYAPLVAEIVKFFRSGVAPVSAEETIEIFAFMEAADESKRQNGVPVRIAELIANAQNQATQ